MSRSLTEQAQQMAFKQLHAPSAFSIKASSQYIRLVPEYVDLLIERGEDDPAKIGKEAAALARQQEKIAAQASRNRQ